jgi:ribosomal-protein-alanine N-acetyltransferase
VPEDRDAVMALQESLFPDDPVALRQDDFQHLCEGSLQIYVADLHGQIVGFVVLRNRRFRLWSGGDFLGVSSEHRLKGIGKALVIHAIQNCRRSFIRIFVRPSNVHALAMYKSLGFHKVSRRSKSYPDGEDALIMMRIRDSNFQA